MTKHQVIHIISKCSKLYHKNLENYNIAFVYRDVNNFSDYMEVQFRSYNFLHFTGVTPRSGLSANDFYRRALNNKLSEHDFSFKNSHTTELKLQILDVIMNIDSKARMIGNYTGSNIELYTEKVTGTTTACLGLIQKDNYYIPNSVLKEDIRTLIPKPPGKIYAIFKKRTSSTLYTKLTYKRKGLCITKRCIPKNLLISIDPSLFEKEVHSQYP
ncbi:MAG: hypothetical protein J1D87_02055 [Lachnospiraceae bacterium]|nr:hypothetical protein [Lachnospiraceae bacterium]